MNFKSDPTSITGIEPLVQEVFEKYDISHDYFGNVLVALTEAMNNAIRQCIRSL
ncbi:MAG: hypothetical protein H3C71_06525 [Flavobacteriales bacterium]|nr:hypothetical protein [Flavobacteriales bacterium]